MSCKEAIYIFLLKVGHFTPKLKILIILIRLERLYQPESLTQAFEVTLPM